jgi:pyruvate dehydrogenase E1 component
MPPMPAGVEDGILKGMYKFRASENKDPKLRAQLLGSGAILREALKAQEILEQKYGVSADVWSVTSYKCLYSDGIDTERWNLMHPAEKPRVPCVTQCLADAEGVLVAASDYLKALPNLISRWTPRRLASLGTDGFGRSESRGALRDFFEVDARFITLATLYELMRDGKIEACVVEQAIKDLEIDIDKPNPLFT